MSFNDVSAGLALRSTLLAILLSCTMAPLSLIAQARSEASAIADQAITSARAGNTREALSLYDKALSIAPDKMEILRDYAIVLGWAGRYSEAIPVIKRVRTMENNQPDWALREFASIYLFGDRTEEALHQYNALIERGDVSEQTLNRRALSLRWLGRRDEALVAYSELLRRYPKSVAGIVGVAYSKSDKGQLSAALHDLESNENIPQDDPEILKARIRILNWMGRHYEAQKLIAALPGPLTDDREILEDRIAAARWGGDPNGAMQELGRFSQLFPGGESQRMSRELRTEYGQSFSPYFSFAKDSDGLMDRKAGADGSIHLNPSYSIHLGYQYRWLEQQQSIRTLLQYNLGLAGNLHPRVSFYSTVGSVDYRTAGAGRKYIGDASLTVAASDRLRISGGGGSVAMDAYQSLPNRVTAPFGFGDVLFNFSSKTKLQARYSRFSFSDGVVRDRVDSQVGQSIVRQSHLKLIAGWRFNWMRNGSSTSDFWSPLRFQSNVAFAQGEGRITSWMDYFGELAGGWQSELGSPVQHPFQVTGHIAIHPNRHWRTVLEAGKSTSSLDRALPGQRNYSRWVASATMEFRFP